MTPAARTDAELMIAFQQGDTGAFTELYQRHLKGLLNFFWRMCWDRALAEDLAHDTVLKLFRSAHDWEDRAKFTTFLYRVARNLWIDHVRSAAVRRRRGSLDADSGDGSTFQDYLADPDRGPEEEAEGRELRERIMRAVGSLPEEQRMVFVLAHVQELRYQDVAEILGVPLGTVKSRMHAAVSKLQGMLGDLAGIPAESVRNTDSE